MKRIKVSEATGAALDWLVAKCEGLEVAFTTNKEVIILREGVTDYFDPHRNWGWGGPIIDRERIAIQFGPLWVAIHHKHLGHPSYGPTPLVAAMRCYCCAKLGEFADIPEELCQQESN